MIPFITPCHQCLHLLHFLENSSLISACSLCPGSLTHHSYLKTGPSTSLSFPPIVHASQLPAEGLLDSCFPLQVEPGVTGYSKSEGPGPLSHLWCRRWCPLLSTTAFSHKKILDTQNSPRCYRGMHKSCGDRGWISNLIWGSEKASSSPELQRVGRKKGSKEQGRAKDRAMPWAHFGKHRTGPFVCSSLETVD